MRLSPARFVWQDRSLPFTLAHPAAVLPLRRTRLVFSALVIGSLVPDLPYFIFLRENKGLGHSMAGVFDFCLPAGLALLWLFHGLLKRPLVMLAPEFVRRRIGEEDLQFRFGPGQRFALIIGSLLLGVATHLLWDAFTHVNGYFVEHWPTLSVTVMTYRSMPLWHALQYVCSVVGVGIVVVVAGLWWMRKHPVHEPVAPEMSPRLRWFVNGVAIVLALMVGTAAGLDRLLRHHYGWKGSLIQLVVVAITAGIVEMILFSVSWHWTRALRSNSLVGTG
jgi:hypothetical protein